MTVAKFLGLCAAALGLCFVFKIVCTKWGMRFAWLIIILGLAYLSVP